LTGDISVSDIDLAQASEAVVLGFNVQVPPAADAHAKECGIEVKQYNVIYDLVDDIRKAMEGMMEPEEVRLFLESQQSRRALSSASLIFLTFEVLCICQMPSEKQWEGMPEKRCFFVDPGFFLDFSRLWLLLAYGSWHMEGLKHCQTDLGFPLRERPRTNCV
jgi:hypothetical protein